MIELVFYYIARGKRIHLKNVPAEAAGEKRGEFNTMPSPATRQDRSRKGDRPPGIPKRSHEFFATGRANTPSRGAIAQLGEHRLCKPRVRGSIPLRSTTSSSSENPRLTNVFFAPVDFQFPDLLTLCSNYRHLLLCRYDFPPLWE